MEFSSKVARKITCSVQAEFYEPVGFGITKSCDILDFLS